MPRKKKNITTSSHCWSLGEPRSLLLLLFLLLLLAAIPFSTFLENKKLHYSGFTSHMHTKIYQNSSVLKPTTHKLICPLSAHRPSSNTSQRHKNEGAFKFNKGETTSNGVYHNWDLFQSDFQQMLNTLKIFVYPDIYNNSSSFAGIFVPHPNPYTPKLSNYFSEHMFKINILRSSFLTSNPEEAHFFFLPFSINSMRNDPRVHSEAAIAEFVGDYLKKVSEKFGFWNRSNGADHFYVCCHSVGRDAASKFIGLHRNSVQVVCSSSYYQKFYVAHKDIALPQVWPRFPETNLVPPEQRTTLAFFAGRGKNSRIRQQLMSMWENDSLINLSEKSHKSYEEGFRNSKYCLHVKGYEVNTARISDAIHFGCVPVIISNHYDLPFANVLDWSKFSVIVNHNDIPHLKAVLLSISEKMYASFHANLHQVRKHFRWHASPKDYDTFLMTVYQLWLRRGIQFPSLS